MSRSTRFPAPPALENASQSGRIQRIGRLAAAMSARSAAVLGLSLVIVAAGTSPGMAADSRVGEIGNKAVDAVLLRPGGALRMVVGGLFMVPASLFNLAALPSQGLAVYQETAEVLVLEPFRYTFQRPLGEDLEGG
ncbi:MAG: hypothetical protein AB8G23_11315 [Myxococcota bacterium]